jgi:outer membrane protein assembly factor BamB
MNERRALRVPRRLALLAAAAALAGVAGAGDWDLFRGDAGLTGVARDALPAHLELLWVFDAEEAFESAAALHGGVVYAGSADGQLYAVHSDSGRLKWKYAATGAIKSAPAVIGGTVFFGDEEGVFHAVDADGGQREWSFEAEAEIVSSANFADGRVIFGSHDESLYCVTAGQVVSAGCDGFLRVVDLGDGSELRRVALGGYVGASPALHSGRAYVGTFENEVLAIDLGRGEVVWRYENPERKFPFLSSAATDGKLVIVGGRDKLVHAIDAATGKAVWTYAAGARVDSSPVIAGSRVFIGVGGGEIVALGLESGEPVWKFDTGSPIVASPSVADARLVIGTTEGRLFCFGAARSEAAGKQGE